MGMKKKRGSEVFRAAFVEATANPRLYFSATFTVRLPHFTT